MTTDVYTGRRWRNARVRYLTRNPLCAICQQGGKVTIATVVDHIQPHKGNERLLCDEGNWQPLCKPCHDVKSFRHDTGFGGLQLTPAWMPKASKPLIVVCGPPMAGKTHYVNQNAQPGDLVFDADIASQEKYGLPLHLLDDEQHVQLFKSRNNLIAKFNKGETPHPRAWLIATAGSYRQRKFWADIGAEVVVVHPGVDTCIMRLESDHDREAAREKLLSAIRSWR